MMGWEILFRTIQLVQLLILVRVILSWIVGPYPTNPAARLLYQVTDPILEPIRRVVPDLGPIDISPMVAILLLQLLQQVLVRAAFY